MLLCCNRLHLCDRDTVKGNSDFKTNSNSNKQKQKQRRRKSKRGSKLKIKDSHLQMVRIKDGSGMKSNYNGSSDSDSSSNGAYYTHHYEDQALISQLKKDGDEEDDALFESDESHDLWQELSSAKDRIDTYLLERKIKKHILKLSMEEELTPFEFNDDFINMDEIKANDGQELWTEYFKPISERIFKEIQDQSNDVIPLHLFARYPFNVSMVFHDFQQLWELEEKETNVAEASDKELIETLDKLKFLNCQNKEQRTKIIHYIRESTEYGSKMIKFMINL